MVEFWTKRLRGSKALRRVFGIAAALVLVLFSASFFLDEPLVGGVAKLLENQPRQEVATKADITGPVEKPEISTW